MKILVMSDNHGQKDYINFVLKNEIYDISIHLGDADLSRKWLDENFDYYVCGNHEFWEPYEQYINIENLKILLLHGHTRGISMFNTQQTINNILDKEDVNILMHGHTHTFSFGETNGKFWLCPGSTDLSRGKEGNGYVIIDIEGSEIKNVNFIKRR